MIKAAIEKLQALIERGIPPVRIDEAGRTYYDKALVPCQQPSDAVIVVETLSGFSAMTDVLMRQVDTVPCFIHVVSPIMVTLESVRCDLWGRRRRLITCQMADYRTFDFETYLDQDRFCIGLQAYFDQTPDDMNYLYKIAGNLTAEQVRTGTDDGVSQTVGQRIGVVLSDKLSVRRTVTLKPWRTFRDIPQPSSTFLFRFKSVENGLPLLSLHTADGEQWQQEALKTISGRLGIQHPSIPVVA